jgi:hypothetical protein
MAVLHIALASSSAALVHVTRLDDHASLTILISSVAYIFCQSHVIECTSTPRVLARRPLVRSTPLHRASADGPHVSFHLGASTILASRHPKNPRGLSLAHACTYVHTACMHVIRIGRTCARVRMQIHGPRDVHSKRSAKRGQRRFYFRQASHSALPWPNTATPSDP